ncbi:hypothetical protein [Paenarthrobacter nicotinovorans]|uniref:hypothetical protein n=1 Tax=Paenarthrobacter nicotinovorans TaxID=29320 RepID=UPI0039A4629E
MSERIPGYISVTLVAGTLTRTGNGNAETGHQLQMAGAANFFHIQPEVAAQWVEVLTPIAQEASK